MMPPDAVEIYLMFRLLPAVCRPALVVRDDGATMVAIDPRSTNYALTSWSVDHLTSDELTTIRAAYGVPPVGQPCPDCWLNDSPVNTVIPEPLRPHFRSERSA